MSVIHAPTKRELRLGEVLPLALVLVGLGVLLLRLWYLQVVRGEELSERAQQLRTNSVSKLAPRGLIFDRNGQLVAGVQPEIVVTAIPSVVKKNRWVLGKVAAMVGAPPEKLEEKLKQNEWRPHLPAAIHVGVPVELAGRILESGDDLPGIGLESQPMRWQPDTVSLCHVLGHVWTPSDRDVARLDALGVKPAQYVGRDGLERVYDVDLMGKEGSEVLEFDARRRPMRVVGRDNPIPGSRLILGVDLKLQQLAQSLLEGKKGAAVALDPTNGEVLCLVSSPGFDAKVFERGISTADLKALYADESRPLINRAIQSRYAPGSTFKIVVSIAAMESGVWSPNRPTFCNGFYPLTKTKCLGRHGSITYHSAFARSCNTYFSDLAMRVGPAKLKEVALRLGLGGRTGIDLPGEDKGIVPTGEWLKRRELRWYPGDTVNMGIGQGYLGATPLQMACVAALAANGGISYKPHLLRAKVPPGGEGKPQIVEPQVLSQINLGADQWLALQSAMTAVIESGTARVATIPGLAWGGKTGSAEHRKREQTHSWFVGAAPLPNPRISVCVLVEAAGHGSTVAAPIAREIVKAYLARESQK